MQNTTTFPSYSEISFSTESKGTGIIVQSLRSKHDSQLGGSAIADFCITLLTEIFPTDVIAWQSLRRSPLYRCDGTID